MPGVHVLGASRIKVEKEIGEFSWTVGGRLLRQALEQSQLESVDAIYASSMMSGELEGQMHLAALVAEEAGQSGAEAMDIASVSASGAAAIRAAFLAIKSGEVRTVAVVGLERMSAGDPNPVLRKALHAVREADRTMVLKNATALGLYLKRYGVPHSAFADFAVNAHANGAKNPLALFQKEVSREQVIEARMIADPLRLFDCSPVCDGGACIILSAESYKKGPVLLTGSGCATDRFVLEDRADPLEFLAARMSFARACEGIGRSAADIRFFEVHDAFNIMACLCLEACGFADRGKGYTLAENGTIRPEGSLPIATMGGLKARGHPIGATALYQAAEIFAQLTRAAGANQLRDDRLGPALMQSIGGAGTTLFTHLFEPSQ
ncbi:MAG: hypothetical protein KDK37_06205 [Leptospiraceae bacterium]|nr:hypothetical protein [Leptospiraceae bacterium]